MIKTMTFLLTLFASVLLSFGAKQKEPEIRKEMRGKTEYMFINGIKVHEIDPKKQPQPKIVKPKPFHNFYGASRFKQSPLRSCKCLLFPYIEGLFLSQMVMQDGDKLIRLCLQELEIGNILLAELFVTPEGQTSHIPQQWKNFLETLILISPSI